MEPTDLLHYRKGYGSWWSAKFQEGGSTTGVDWTLSFAVSQHSHDRLVGFGIGLRLVGSQRPKLGDIVYYRFRGRDGDFTHAAVVSRVTRRGTYVAQHTHDYEKRFGDVKEVLNNDTAVTGLICS